MSEDTVYLIALTQIQGVGAVTARQLISYCGGAKEVFQARYGALIRIPGIGDQTARTVLRKESLVTAEKELLSCEKAGVFVCSYKDLRYPRRLSPLYDAPLVLFLDGEMDLNSGRTVGIVGTRKITDYGKAMTTQIIKDLVPYTPLVVSGLAYGVDIVAHREALRHSLPTVGVMASGIDVIYPRSHEKTVRQMRQNGGVVTENGLGVRPDFQRFPARNRIIAGLSDVLIVVESAARGGGLITAEFALNYHRDVYAVPGRLDQPVSEGCNQLIRANKAALFTGVADMTEELRWRGTGENATTLSLFMDERAAAVYEGFSTEESQLLSLLRTLGVVQIDELQWHSGLSPGKVATLLLSLEFKGFVKCLPGKKYGLV